MLKKIILISLGVVILAIAGLTVYVSTLDWNSRKDDIAARFSQLLGKKIEFTDNVAVSLFPHPHLSVDGVNILENGSNEKIATIGRMETGISLRSLLSGIPDVDSMELNRVELWYTVNKDGSANWHKLGSTQLAQDETESHLHNFNIQNSTIHYVNKKYDISFDLEQFNADVQADSLTGPYRIDGNFMKGSNHFGVALSVSDITQMDDVPVSFALTDPKSEGYIRYDGTYNIENRYINGDFTGGAARTAEFINNLTGKTLLAEDYNIPLQFSVNAQTEYETVHLDSLVIKFGQLIEGSGSIDALLTKQQDKRSHIAIRYQMVESDIRPLITFLQKEFAAYQSGEKVFEPDSDYDISFDLSSEKVTISSEPTGYFENVSAKGEWKNNEFSLNEFYAACPGNIVLNMTGSVVEENSAPHYFAKVAADGQNLLNLINALGIKLETPVQSSYHDVQIGFDLAGDPQKAEIGNFKLNMDKMKAEGVLQAQYDQKAYQYSAVLSVDTINLDNYIFVPETKDDFAQNVQDDWKRLAFLKDFPLHVELTAANAVFRGVAYENVNIAADVSGNTLNLTRVSIDDVLDSKVVMDASLSELGTDNVVIDHASYDITTQNVDQLATKLAINIPQWKAWENSTVKILGSMQGKLSDFGADFQMINDDFYFSYSGNLVQHETAEFKGKAEFKTTHIGRLLQSLGHKDVLLNNNTLNCSGDLSGSRQNWTFEQAKCVLGTAEYKGNIVVNTDKNYQIKANLDITDFDLINVIKVQEGVADARSETLYTDNFIARPNFSRNIINYDIYRNVDLDINLKAQKFSYKNFAGENLQTHLINAQNVMSLQELKFKYKGADYTGDMQINYIQNPRIKGVLNAKNMNINELGGKLYKFALKNMEMESSFESSASSVNDFMSSLTGELKISADDVVLSGMDFAAINKDLTDRQHSDGTFQAIRDNLQKGASEFNLLNGKVAMSNGILDLNDIVLENSIVRLLVAGKISLSEWKMDVETQTQMLKLNEIPSFSFSLNGMMNKPTLDVNIEKLVQKYDEHWEKISLQEQQKKENQQKKLEKDMTSLQEKVGILSTQLNAYMAKLENYHNSSDTDETKMWYKRQLDAFAATNKRIDSIQAVARQASYSQEDVQNAEKEYQSCTDDFAHMVAEIDRYYKSDLLQKLYRIKERAAGIDVKRSKLFDEYQKMLQDDFDILMKLDSSQYMVNNAELKMKQNRLANTDENLRNLYKNFKKDYEQKIKLTTVEDQEMACRELNYGLKNMQDEYDRLENARNEISDMLFKLINERQKEYDAKNSQVVHAAENPANENLLQQQTREVAEMYENIAAVDTESETVNSDSEEENVVEKPNVAKNKDLPAEVSDNSGDSAAISGKIVTSYDLRKSEKMQSETAPQILKPITDSVPEVSGVIKVKD